VLDLLGQLDLADLLGLPHPLTPVAKQISFKRATTQSYRPRLSHAAGGGCYTTGMMGAQDYDHEMLGWRRAGAVYPSRP
jgi:hypothetical protein